MSTYLANRRCACVAYFTCPDMYTHVAAILVLSVFFTAELAAQNSSSYHLARGEIDILIGNANLANMRFAAAREASNDVLTVDTEVTAIVRRYWNEYPEDYDLIVTILEDVLQSSPSIAQARYELGRVKFEQAYYSAAEQHFGQLLSDSLLSPYAKFYLALIAIERKQYQLVERYLEPVSELPPDLQARSNFYLGVAKYGQRKYIDAKHHFAVVASSAIAEPLFQHAADEYVSAIKTQAKPWWLRGQAFGGYDSNVFAIADNDPVLSDLGISERDDFYFQLWAQAGYVMYDNPRNTLSASYTAFQLAHDKAQSYDQQGHTLDISGTAFRNKYQASSTYNYEYWRLNDKKYRIAHTITGAIQTDLLPHSTTSASYRFRYVDRFDDPALKGRRHQVGISHQIDFGAGQELSLTYEIEHTDTQGDNFSGTDEFDSLRHGLDATLVLPLGEDWVADIGVAGNWINFPNPDADGLSRRDRYGQLRLGLSRKLNEFVQLRIGGTFEDNDSNVPDYDYDRYRLEIGLLTSY